MTAFIEEAAIITEINKMPVERWFRSIEVTGVYNARIAHTLWTMAQVGQTNGEYILINAGGGANQYMWTNTAKWNEATQ